MAGIRQLMRNVYEDAFQWCLVKSIGLFALGVKIAIECKGMELMPPMTG